MKFLPVKSLLATTSLMFLGAVAAPAFSQTVRVDGSSTVFPVTEAVAEEFQKANKGQKVVVRTFNGLLSR